MTTDASPEYEQFRQTFFEECVEILGDLESRLVELKPGPDATDELNAIFRAVHSIKAGAGAFNYTELVHFTHIFETLLDYMRDGRLAPDERVTPTLTRAGDILSALVAMAQENESPPEDFGSEVAEELKALLVRAGGGAAAAAETETGAAPEDAAEANELATYRIKFTPHAELFRHANEPLLLIRELKTLGELTVLCDVRRLPNLWEIEPEEAYLAWEFELSSTHSRQDIIEVFEFVDEDCELTVEQVEGGAASGATASRTRGKAGATADDGELAIYDITFRPHAELFRHANEPLLLIRELKTLGQLTARCDQSRLPNLWEIEPEEAYLGWQFELRSAHSRQDILAVFEFVDQDCELSVELRSTDTAPSPVAQVSAPKPVTAPPQEPPPAAPAARKANGAGNGATPPAAGDDKAARKTGGSIRVDIDRIDRLVNMAGELVIAQSMLTQQIQDYCTQNGVPAIKGHEDLASLTRELQECVMAVRMQPVRSVFMRMPRLAREVAGKLGKTVKLTTFGEQTEVDKTVIEELADPLTHMIRNAVDHGVEMPDERRRKGKPGEGRIELSASHVGSNILIQLKDDGAGIDRERLRNKAIDRGVIAPDAKLSQEEIDDLIFAPGLSTAGTVTDFSGRGVGMDVVRRNVTALGGRIQVQSTPGEGTRFTLAIPLTLAVLDGMAVAVGTQRYIIPLTSIVESFRPSPHQIRTLTDGRQLTLVRGEFFRVLHLDQIFSIPDAVDDPWNGLVVLLETAGGETVGVKVDELLGQQQVVIKNLQENFQPVPGIAGATILGDGDVALILDIEALAMNGERGRLPVPNAEETQTENEDYAAAPQQTGAADQHALSA